MLLPYLVLVGHLIKLVNTAATLKSQQIHAKKKQPCNEKEYLGIQYSGKLHQK
jgi:hypothetical protein